ncbi:hypothetical protein ABZX40_12170 [Streptomyces sp. NPDC004610]|uniref:hypothetical protein n=1 Tax=unclassified Streptomyces TaxID=2593676 RepID=UPI0033AD14D4
MTDTRMRALDLDGTPDASITAAVGTDRAAVERLYRPPAIAPYDDAVPWES